MRRELIRGRSARSGVVLAAVLALGATGLTGTARAGVQESAAAAWDPAELTPLTTPGMAVPLERAGEVGFWGDNAYGQSTVPASLDGVAISQVVRPDGRSALLLTADGHVVGLGKHPDKLEVIPPAVEAEKIVQITTGTYAAGYAGAVTDDGRVIVWGKKRTTANPAQVPAGLIGVKQLVISAYSAGAIKADGSVVTWGQLKGTAQPPSQSATPPAGLKAAAIAVNGTNSWVALKPDGSLTSWGQTLSGSGMPSALKVPGSVKAIVGYSEYFLALLTNNTTMSFGYGPAMPAELTNNDTVLLASGPGTYEAAIVDRQRKIHYWRNYELPGTVPTTWDGQDIAQIAIGHYSNSSAGDPTVPTGGVIVTKMLRAAAPRVAGAATVGGTLTATPGTFSASPDSVTGQWLADGAEIPGETGTSLVLTSDRLGQQISYSSTATKAGQTTISSTSPAVKVLVPATVGLAVARGVYGTASTVVASVAGVSGSVSLTVDGKSLGVKVLAGGRASFAVAAGTGPGNHAVKATYAGGTDFGPGSASATLSVGRGRTGAPTVRVTKASSKKKGTLTVTVPTAVGLAKASGKATVVLKKAKTSKRITLTLVNGHASGKLPKLPKGSWTATVTFLGSGYYVPATSRATKVRSK